MLTCIERARKGAALLDSVEPNWYNRIELATFAIASCINCVLAQLFSSWGTGLTQLRMQNDTDSILEHGFDHGGDHGYASNDLDPATGLSNKEALQQAWLAEIYQRRLHKQIEVEAYLLWEAAGRPQDDGQYFWQQAQDKLTNQTWTVTSGGLATEGEGNVNEVIATALTYAHKNDILLANVVTVAGPDYAVVVRDTLSELKRCGLWGN